MKSIDLIDEIGLDKQIETTVPMLGECKLDSPLLGTEGIQFVSDEDRVLVRTSFKSLRSCSKAQTAPLVSSWRVRASGSFFTRICCDAPSSLVEASVQGPTLSSGPSSHRFTILTGSGASSGFALVFKGSFPPTASHR